MKEHSGKATQNTYINILTCCRESKHQLQTLEDFFQSYSLNNWPIIILDELRFLLFRNLQDALCVYVKYRCMYKVPNLFSTRVMLQMYLKCVLGFNMTYVNVLLR